jgi:hypothetical protein
MEGSCAAWQMAELERAADAAVELESRVEVAEGERDAAQERMRAMTPRPALPPGMHLPAALGPAGTARFIAAVTRHRCRMGHVPTSSVASSRVGLASSESVLRSSLPVGRPSRSFA